MLLELPVIREFRETLLNFKAHPVFFLCLYVLIPLSLICSFICLIIIFRKIKSLEKKTVRMRQINSYIQKGASVYLHQQSKMLLIVVAILFIPVGLTGIEFLENELLGFFIVGVIFVIGAISSLVAGYIGMLAATKANILVTVGGREKAVMIKSAKKIVTHNPNCKGVILPNIGHGVSFVKPDYFNQLIESWLKKDTLPQDVQTL